MSKDVAMKRNVDDVVVLRTRSTAGPPERVPQQQREPWRSDLQRPHLGDDPGLQCHVAQPAKSGSGDGSAHMASRAPPVGQHLPQLFKQKPSIQVSLHLPQPACCAQV